MPKYSVRIDARIIHPVTTVSATIEVEADNEEAAEDKAREQAEAGDVEWQHVDDNADQDDSLDIDEVEVEGELGEEKSDVQGKKED